MSEAVAIERTAFSTSRLLDFVSEKELTLQCGYGPEDWPLVVVKELVDNALDACEEQGIPPDITVTVADDLIVVADNGAGIPPGTVKQMLDFSIRVSSREAYVAPDRGAQGNALKTIVAMPFVLDGEEGRVAIAGQGVLHEITFRVDRIAEEPVSLVVPTEQNGSFVRLHWPFQASSEANGKTSILTSRAASRRSERELGNLVASFALFNPHASFTLDLFGAQTRIEATDQDWKKWRPSSPTTPHWYTPQHLEHLLGAYVKHDRRNGRARTVRDFLAEFRDLSSTVRRKRVLNGLDLDRQPLAGLLAADGEDFDQDLVARLLAAMQEHAKPVKPPHLGVIGRDHIEARFEQLGIHEGSFEYKRKFSTGPDGLPLVVEVAFAALEDEEPSRYFFAGVNWSAAWRNPFRQLGDGTSLDSLLFDRRLQEDQPVALLVHVAHPRVEYADRGKSTVLIRGNDIAAALASVGKKWTQQIKAEERRSSARRRHSTMYASAQTSLKDICSENMEEAYLKASGNGSLPTSWRQVFYIMRPLVADDPRTDKRLVDTYFKTVLDEYLEDYEPGWDILRGARGTFKEPHRAQNDNGLAMSTMNVRNYLGAVPSNPKLATLSSRFPTAGASNRIAAVLICEKEGFDETLEAHQIPDRFDVGLMSTKGVSVFAARNLAASFDVPCFTLHDMDKNGFVMAAGFPDAIDLGLRMADVEEWELEPEDQDHGKTSRWKIIANLLKNGATQEEADFIADGQRVELNMLSSPDFVQFVTRKLEAHGVRKVVPDEETLAAAWKRTHLTRRVNRLIESTWPGHEPAQIALHAEIPPVPDDLEDQIREKWADGNDTLAWDQALASIVGKHDEGEN